ncbi:ABC transporter ATP-binding protein [Rhodococcus sp. SJ-3]|uniref:ABC transporter ATP-binding protein n=1 Tax=Rhodococcus sp. SJ-3 TaxID=3454628 RepID=UPI003F7AA376
MATGSGIRSLLYPVGVRLLISGVLQVFCAIGTVLPFIAITEVTRELLGGGVVPWGWVWAAVVALVVTPLVHSCSFSLSFGASRDTQYRTRRNLVGHLARVPLGWFGGVTGGGLRKLVSSDVAALTGLIGEAVPLAPRFAAVSVLAIAYLAWIDPLFAIVIALPVVIASVLLVRRPPIAPDLEREYRRAARGLSERATELGQGMAVWKVFSGNRIADDRFVDAIDQHTRSYLATERARDRRGRLPLTLSSWSFILVWTTVWGVVFVATDLLVPADLIPFLLMCWIVSRAVWLVPTLRTLVSRSRALAESLDRAFATPELPTGDRTLAARRDITIRFADVTFEYDRGRTVIEDIDLELTPGTVTAVVGPSGSGKSTLTRLLPRFWDVTGGTITVDGIDIRGLDPAELYRLIGFVFQDVRMLRRTVADNIRLADPAASDERVRAAARAARIHDRILEEPLGYDAVIGEHVSFSGGEAQRISIARAILADPPVLVLDEATSAADPESESLVQDAIAALSRDKTVLMVAHRLETVVNSDVIVVMESGRIAERGTHTELMNRGGRYANMWRSGFATTGAAG